MKALNCVKMALTVIFQTITDSMERSVCYFSCLNIVVSASFSNSAAFDLHDETSSFILAQNKKN